MEKAHTSSVGDVLQGHLNRKIRAYEFLGPLELSRGYCVRP